MTYTFYQITKYNIKVTITVISLNSYICVLGTSDFFALNHYTTHIAELGEAGFIPSLKHDSGVVITKDPTWKTAKSVWLHVSILIQYNKNIKQAIST